MYNKSARNEQAFYLKDLIRFNARRGFSAWMMGIDYFRCMEYTWALYFLSQKTGETILDLGSGASLFPYYLAFRGDSVVCTDLHYEQLKRDYDYWSKSLGLSDDVCTRISLQQEDAIKLTFDDEKFFRISCISVIEHIPDDGDIMAVKEISRVLAPGGKLVITFPYGKWGEKRSFLHGTTFYQKTYDEKAIEERLIKPSGLFPFKKIYFCNRFFDFENIIWRKIPQKIINFIGWTAPCLSQMFLQPAESPGPSTNGAMIVLEKKKR
jgi:SAM-dependent methyltransferase